MNKRKNIYFEKGNQKKIPRKSKKKIDNERELRGLMRGRWSEKREKEKGIP